MLNQDNVRPVWST